MDLTKVVVVGLWGFNGGSDGGIAGLCRRISESLTPVGVPSENIFAMSWNPSENAAYNKDPDTHAHLRAIKERVINPSYIAILGHSLGGWAACRLANQLGSRPWPELHDFRIQYVALIDAIYRFPMNPIPEPEWAFPIKTQRLDNWYQENGAAEPNHCLKICDGTIVGKSHPHANNNHEMNVIRDWDGKTDKVRCLGIKRDKLTWHTWIDSHKFIWRQIHDTICSKVTSD